MLMSSIMRRRNGLMASSVMGMLLFEVRLRTAPHLQTGRPFPYCNGCATCRSTLPRERFSPLAHRDLAPKIHVRNAAESGQTQTDVDDRSGHALGFAYWETLWNVSVITRA